MKRAFFNAGHLPTLVSCVLYFDFSFTVWVLLGIGWFYLAASLGYAQQFTGSYAFGFNALAMLSLAALGGIVTVGPRWRKEISGLDGLAPARV